MDTNIQLQYLATLTIFEGGFRIIHWKLSGSTFHEDHERFDGYYNKISKYLDQVAEYIVSQDLHPLTYLAAKELLQNSDADVFILNGEDDFSTAEANQVAMRMFGELYRQVTVLMSDSTLPVEVVDLYTDHARYYRQSALYKLRRALES